MTVPASAALCIVPAYLRTEQDAEVLLRCLVSLWATRAGADVLVVDDASPARALVEGLRATVAELGFELVRADGHRGPAAALNVGLRRALADGRDAVLLDADVELVDPGWLPALLARTDTQGRPAAIVGARLLYPTGELQHAGRIFSELTRGWLHRHQHGPADLPDALRPLRCPVTGSLMLVRHEALAQVGLLDETMPLGGADLDLCLRAFAAGLECVYEPAAVAVHREGTFLDRPTQRVQRWLRESADRLAAKWSSADLSAFVPEAL